jgi:hypothetical protein
MISTGRLAPPHTEIRRFAAIRSTSTSSVRAPSRPQYIVGTPAKKVMSSFCIRSTTCLASKRGTSTRVAALEKPAFICTLDPKEWNSGSVSRCVSPAGRDPNSRLQVSAFITRLECDSSAPLGCPVVPLV